MPFQSFGRQSWAARVCVSDILRPCVVAFALNDRCF